mmetsp:Transcript_23257/g.26386  ORF Transcript_23257/g.26386 Transcript_23257/m.26386 type:complete len:143 (-) Transcript_23257:191-619(-)
MEALLYSTAPLDTLDNIDTSKTGVASGYKYLQAQIDIWKSSIKSQNTVKKPKKVSKLAPAIKFSWKYRDVQTKLLEELESFCKMKVDFDISLSKHASRGAESYQDDIYQSIRDRLKDDGIEPDADLQELLDRLGNFNEREDL